MLKWGIFSFAHMHANSYAACLEAMTGCEIVGVYDADPDRGGAEAARYGAGFFSDYESMLDELELDVALITAENARHAEICLAAAERRVPVVCEKPLATTTAHARAMIRACEENRVKLFTCFPCRYSPSAVNIKNALAQGRIGQPLAVAATNHGTFPGGWFADRELAGGGAVMDHTVHVADLLRWFLGDEIVRVYAEAGNLLTDAGIDDAGLVTLEFGSGVFATIDCSWSRPKSFPTWGDVTMRIIGVEGNITLDMFGQDLAVYSDIRNKVEWAGWGDNIDRLMLEDFARAIREDGPPPITGLDGMRAMEAALAAYRAAETHEPVSLPLEE